VIPLGRKTAHSQLARENGKKRKEEKAAHFLSHPKRRISRSNDLRKSEHAKAFLCGFFYTLGELVPRFERGGSGKNAVVAHSHESIKRCPEEVRTEKTEEGDVDGGIPLDCSGD